MRLYLECFHAALRSAWRRRYHLLGLLVGIWLPVQIALANVPAKTAVPANLLLEGLAEPIWIGALIHGCHAAHRAKPVSILTAIRRGFGSLPRLIGIRTVLEMRILLGLLGLGVPGIVMLGRYALMDVLSICEKVGPTSCRERSRQLGSEHFPGMLIVLALGNGLPWAIAELANHLAAALGAAWLGVILQLAATLLGAALPLTLFEFYVAQRKRHPLKVS